MPHPATWDDIARDFESFADLEAAFETVGDLAAYEVPDRDDNDEESA
jgi:hypothetical protein